ncbi:MAG TPA: DUF4350 domain-containing protein [Steroidobacteraceae bacterium]|nr:DUF4350 domain-containing protein [Steroidobacteraceae bacterium]
MRERLITLACALGALLLFAALFVRGEGLDLRRVALPTTIERHGNGLLGAMSWLEAEGIRTLSLRERFDTLAKRRDLPRAGNLLIMTVPVATPFRPQEARALEHWIRAGNTLLVLAAMSDSPDWGRGGLGVHNDLQLLTGLDFESVRISASPQNAAARLLEAARELAQPQRGTLVPNRPHAYLRGVSRVIAWSDYPPQSWSVQLPRDGFVLALAHQSETGEGVLWMRPAGPGTIIVSGFGSLFSNRALADADNARLLANIVTATVRAEGAVLFDDEHQGLAAAYDPAKFYNDPRLYGTIGVLAVVWLTWVLGGTHLRLPAMRMPAPREAELVRATGGFLARVLRPAAAARRLFEHFFRRLAARTHRGAQGAGLPWEWLEHHPRLRRADVQQLRQWYAQAYSDRRVPLTRLHNLIVRTERQLAA